MPSSRHPRRIGPEAILALQRIAGNAAVARMLQRTATDEKQPALRDRLATAWTEERVNLHPGDGYREYVAFLRHASAELS
jgi:hypothetical protein